LERQLRGVAQSLGRHFRAEGTVKRVTFTGADLAWRAGIVTLCVVVVTALSSLIGSFASGLFAFFPVAMGSYFVILHPRIGGPATASVAAHVQAPLIGLGLSLMAVHFLSQPIGVWWSYAVGIAELAGARLNFNSFPSAPASPSTYRALPSPRAATCRRD
jgi:hypothetical protein